MEKLYSRQEAAKRCGLQPRSLQYYYWRYQIGRVVGRATVYTLDDIARINAMRSANK